MIKSTFTSYYHRRHPKHSSSSDSSNSNTFTAASWPGARIKEQRACADNPYGDPFKHIDTPRKIVCVEMKDGGSSARAGSEETILAEKQDPVRLFFGRDGITEGGTLSVGDLEKGIAHP